VLRTTSDPSRIRVFDGNAEEASADADPRSPDAGSRRGCGRSIGTESKGRLVWKAAAA
jgi:hypothetical protein